MFAKVNALFLVSVLAFGMAASDALAAGGMVVGGVSVFNPTTGRWEAQRAQPSNPVGMQIGAIAFRDPRTGQYVVPQRTTPLSPSRGVQFDSPNAIIQQAQRQGLQTGGFQTYRGLPVFRYR